VTQNEGERITSLCGVAAVVLIFVGLGAGGSPPNGKASAARVVTYYGRHATAQTVSGVLTSLGAVLFLVFAAAFVARFRRLEAAPTGAAELCLTGAGLVAAGLALFAGIAIAMADVVNHVDPSALQTLNVLANDAVFIFLITIGTCAFLLGAAALSITSPLPDWLGWLAVAFAVVAAIPSHVLGGALDHIGFVGFAGLGLWTVIAGALLAARPGPAAASPT
jgi:hypothetical protein